MTIIVLEMQVVGDKCTAIFLDCCLEGQVLEDEEPGIGLLEGSESAVLTRRLRNYRKVGR